MQLWVDDVRAFVRCPLAWFWEKQAGLPRPPVSSDLLPTAVRTALDFFYRGYANNLGEAMGLVWQDWCAQWGEPALTQDLLHYAKVQAGILSRTKRSNGEPYVAPKLTAFYREQMASARLNGLSRKLDDFAVTHHIFVPSEKESTIGSALGDAFADCLTAVDNARNFAEPLPAPASVLGSRVPYQIALTDGVLVRGTADLAWRVQSKDQTDDGQVVMEVHDFHDPIWKRAPSAKHDLRVIAASLAEPALNQANDAERQLGWTRVAYVVYRHWPSGQTFKCSETNAGHLHNVLNAVARAMRQHLVIPRALAGYDDCRACAYRALCWEDGAWESRLLADPTLLKNGERLRAMTTQLRSAIAGDELAARRARQALEVVATGLEELGSSPDAVPAILAEATHTFGGADQ